MAYSRPAKDVVRLALESAITNELTYLEAIIGTDEETEKDTRQNLNDFRKMLRNRYPPRVDPFADAELVCLADLRTRK